MKTRTAPKGAPLRQERYASSRCFEQGLMANHVARRAALVNPQSKRAALWWIQWRSWQPGGIELLADELSDMGCMPDIRGDSDRFVDNPRLLADMCLNPAYPLESGWRAVDEYRTKWLKARFEGFVKTEIGKRIEEAMTYALETRTTAVIDGDPRIGKTFAAKHVCEQSGGLLRYVQVPSATDMASFFRAIGESLGLATNLNVKAADLQDRIRDALASEDLAICFDEAHYCWPMGRLRYSVPARVNWIMTTLCNMNVPVVMVTTPQFYSAQALLEKQTAWSSQQWIGRISHVERLPQKLSEKDFRSVAASILPDADQVTITALAAYAAESKKHLSAIDAICKRATWLAQKDGRETASTDDVRRAMKESVIPSDMALAKSLAEVPKATPRMRRGGFAARPRPNGEITANTFSRSTTPVMELVKT